MVWSNHCIPIVWVAQDGQSARPQAQVVPSLPRFWKGELQSTLETLEHFKGSGYSLGTTQFKSWHQAPMLWVTRGFFSKTFLSWSGKLWDENLGWKYEIRSVDGEIWGVWLMVHVKNNDRMKRCAICVCADLQYLMSMHPLWVLNRKPPFFLLGSVHTTFCRQCHQSANQSALMDEQFEEATCWSAC